MTPSAAWKYLEGRQKRYLGQRVGGTIVVHFINRVRWCWRKLGELLREHVHNGRYGADEVEVYHGAPCGLLCLERGFGVRELEVLRRNIRETESARHL